MKVKIADIKVGSRFRKKFDKVKMQTLMDSITQYGLWHPIVIDENNALIAGERRLKAHVKLKMDTIEVTYRKDLSKLEKKSIELEENIQREAFTWQEEVEAKSFLHKLKQEIHGQATRGHEVEGAWRLADTALALGESEGTTSMDIQLARGMKAFPELKKEKSKTIAYKKLRKIQAKILHEEYAKRLEKRGLLDNPNVICGNCLEEMEKMEADSVDLIVTDPPYGIDVGKAHTYGRMTIKDTFEDSDFETIDLLDKAFAQMYRLLRNDRHMYLFCAIDKIPVLVRLLVKCGFEVHKLPLMWDKGSGSYPSQSTTYVHSYETLLHVMKGRRKLNGTPRDVFQVKRVPPTRKTHPTEKPTELLRDLIKMSSMPGEVVFDPFAGSFSTLVAAKETSRRAIGIEIDRVMCETGTKRLEGGEPDESVS